MGNFTHCLTIKILFSPIFDAKDVGKTANESLAFKRFVTLYTPGRRNSSPT